MTDNILITNARIVLRDEEFTGTARMSGGRIADLAPGRSMLPHAEDWNGDYLLPGLVELHTDNLEKHLMPRPKVSWPEFPALLSHDAEIAAAGITTVFDALGVGDVDAQALRGQGKQALLDSLDHAEAEGLLRADHRLHVRCELPAPNTVTLFEPFARCTRVGLLSLMDHTPGQRQWTDIDKARTYYTGKKGWSHEKFDAVMADGPALQQKYADPHRRYFVEHARTHGIPVASHDDTTPDHVAQAAAEGVTISEFPTSETAARHARAAGLATVMGAPNVVRGGSHSGNACATSLAAAGLLDALSSDYVPASLLHAAFLLRERAGYTTAAAVATVSAHPARMARLDDRGDIAVGKRADFSRTRVSVRGPSVLAVWRAGRRVV